MHRDEIKSRADIISAFRLGAVISGMVYLGDRLGLYRAMQGAGPLSPDALAEQTGLKTRWILEWLRSQAGAGILDHDDGRFALSDATAAVLADESDPACVIGSFAALPHLLGRLDDLPEVFRTGQGLPFGASDPAMALATERVRRPWFRNALVPRILPALDGVAAKLKTGGRVADLGCGSGIALFEMAKAFPASEFVGYDTWKQAIELAESRRKEERFDNVSFQLRPGVDVAGNGRFDLVTTLDVLHDLPHPDRLAAAVYDAIDPDGSWLIEEIRPLELSEQPRVGGTYAVSVLYCLSSGMSEPGGAGLGTLGLPEEVARDLTQAAGFTRFKVHDFGHANYVHYEVRR